MGFNRLGGWFGRLGSMTVPIDLFDDGEDDYLKTTVDISSSQLLAINTTPIVLVAAQSGKVILPVSILITSAYGGTAYANVSGVAVFLGVSAAAGSQIVSYSGTLFTATADRASITPPVLSAVGNLTAYINQPVILSANADFTTGNGTAKALIIYDILDV